MINIKSVLHIIGLLIASIGLAMYIPAGYEYFVQGTETITFFTLGSMSLIIGISLALAFKNKKLIFSIKDTFVLTSFSWLLLCIFAALPLWLSQHSMSFIDSFFEATSGLTTTGATVLSNLDNMAKGILLWRALLQWLGGLGIIVIALAILPILNIGGMQLFNKELNDTPENLKPRATELAKLLIITYLTLTSITALLLWFAGLSKFDSICHAMTTIATGGFSTHDKSIGFYDNYIVEIIIMFGMVLSSLPFTFFFTKMNSKNSYITNSQIKVFLILTITFIFLLSSWLFLNKDYNLLQAIRAATFNGISVMTGTGYATENFTNWGSFAVTLMLLMMLVGGCTGSTTGGLKIFRIQILFVIVFKELKKISSPHSISKVIYAGSPVDKSIVSSVIVIVLVFFITIFFVTVCMSLSGYDLLTSLSAAITAIAIVGPGIGHIIGPAENFSSLKEHIKIILSIAMILGRLEFLTILVILLPKFWIK